MSLPLVTTQRLQRYPFPNLNGSGIGTYSLGLLYRQHQSERSGRQTGTKAVLVSHANVESAWLLPYSGFQVSNRNLGLPVQNEVMRGSLSRECFVGAKMEWQIDQAIPLERIGFNDVGAPCVPPKVGYRPYPTFSGIVPRSVPQFLRGCRRTSSDGFGRKFPSRC